MHVLRELSHHVLLELRLLALPNELASFQHAEDLVVAQLAVTVDVEHANERLQLHVADLSGGLNAKLVLLGKLVAEVSQH